jgi:hypothetical protein
MSVNMAIQTFMVDAFKLSDESRQYRHSVRDGTQHLKGSFDVASVNAEFVPCMRSSHVSVPINKHLKALTITCRRTAVGTAACRFVHGCAATLL